MADGLTLTEDDANTIFPDDDLEDGVISSLSDSENVESLNDLISDPDDVILPPSTMITETTTDIAVPAPAEALPATTDLSVVLATTTPPERKPVDDCRRLFQRLWTDEDEIELLQGFLDYTSSRGGVHHHDTTLFYDQVQGRLKLEFNKNQLVEKLRRLKKKYRNVVAKMNSSKDFAFKSSHDHATYELSRKIWFNIHRVGGRGRGRGRGAAVGNGGSTIAEFDDDEQIPKPNPSYNPVMVNLNTMSPACAGSGGFNTMSVNSSGGGGGGGGLAKLSTRKRQKVEKVVKIETGTINNNANSIDNNNLMSIDYNNVVSIENLKNVSVMSPLQGLVEETLNNCLSPVLKDVINSRANATPNPIAGEGGGEGGIHRFKGVETLAMNTVPLHLPKVNVGEGMDEKWRKQQIMELELYSKRLELVQEQIKLSLEELKSVEELKSMES